MDSDCVRLARKNPELKGSYCENHACTVPVGGRHECESNEDCIQAAQGDAAMCRDFQCVRLRSAGCSLVLNQTALSTTNDVVVLGAFERLDSINTAQRGGLDSYTLAAKEMQRANGIVGYTDLRVRRPIVFVVCDNANTPKLDATFDHLTKTLKVPVLVSTLDSTVLSAQLARMSSDAAVDTMIVNAFSSDSSLDYTDGPRRIWSVLGNPLQDLGPGYVLLAKRQLSKIASATPHVLLVTSENVEMLELANFVESELRLSDEARYEYKRVAVAAPDANGDSDTSAVTSAIATLAPDLVIVLGGEELRAAAIWGNENRVPPAQAASSGPSYYVLSHHLANSAVLTQDVKLAGTVTGLHRRMLGLNFAGAKDTSLYDIYLSNLRAEFPDAAKGFENYYDAAYYAMLAVAAVAHQRPTSELTGTLASQGFKRLIDLENGIEHFRLGEDPLSKILWTLESQDRSISVTGTLGPPDFSLQTGARHTDATVWCYRESASTQLEWYDARIRYDRTTVAFDADPDSCWQPQP